MITVVEAIDSLIELGVEPLSIRCGGPRDAPVASATIDGTRIEATGRNVLQALTRLARAAMLRRSGSRILAMPQVGWVQ